MAIDELTIDKLKKLPLRAIIAFAARCARRVEPLAQLPADHPGHEARHKAIEEALGLAECFAMGKPCHQLDPVMRAVDVSRRAAGGDDGSELATAAAAEAIHAVAGVCLAYDPAEPGRIRHTLEETKEVREGHSARHRVSVDIAALNAFTAAADGVLALGLQSASYISTALNDYDKLLGLNLGDYPELGAPIDPSAEGPLGPL